MNDFLSQWTLSFTVPSANYSHGDKTTIHEKENISGGFGTICQCLILVDFLISENTALLNLIFKLNISKNLKYFSGKNQVNFFSC